MANEWVKVELYGANNDGGPRRFTVASGTAISKGTLLAMTDARTAVAQSSLRQACCGVAAMDKSATDLSTSISAWTNGIFEAKASGAIVVGNAVMASEPANTVILANTASIASGAKVIGYALETAADAETINVRLNL